MNYLNIETNQYPVTEERIRQENPSVVFGSPFIPLDKYKPVTSTVKPAFNELTHYVRELHPVLGPGGFFLQQWEVVEHDPAMQEHLEGERVLEMWNAIKLIRDEKIQTGGYAVGGEWYHSDTFSRTQQMGLVMMGANIPSGLQWKTMDGSFVTMTQQLATDIFAAAAASDQALFAYAEQLRAQVEAAENPNDVDIYSGWPAVFGEE